MNIKNSLLCIVLLLSLSLSGCEGNASASIQVANYAQISNWLMLTSSPFKDVDVFYVYPTAYTKASSSDPDFCTIDNASMVQGAKSAFQRQATAFAPYANIRRVPGADVLASFEHYLNHFNNGCPFILVGHSQGSAVLKYLLSDYMKNHPDVYKRMIAAYVVGQSITAEYLKQNPHLKFATGPRDAGVIVSWNAEAPVIDGTNPVTQPGGIAINPITWTTEEVTADASLNRGSIELDLSTGLPRLDQYGEIMRVTNLADATVNKARGVVICSTVDPHDYYFGFPLGVYHTFDYPFYFFNVRQNAADRIQQYFAEN
jgi:hypothetical protein